MLGGFEKDVGSAARLFAAGVSDKNEALCKRMEIFRILLLLLLLLLDTPSESSIGGVEVWKHTRETKQAGRDRVAIAPHLDLKHFLEYYSDIGDRKDEHNDPRHLFAIPNHCMLKDHLKLDFNPRLYSRLVVATLRST